MRDDNDLLPAVDTGILTQQQYLNARRLRAWRLKWRLKFGVWPDGADIYSRFSTEDISQLNIFDHAANG